MKQKKTAALILVLLCMASLGGCKLLGDPARVMVIEQEGEYTLAPGYSEIYIQAKNVVIADAEVDKITVAEELEDADIRLENVEAELVTIMPGCTGKMEFSGNCGIEKVVLDQTGEMAVGMEDTASVETLHINDCGAVQIDGNCAVLENYSDDVALKGGSIEQAELKSEGTVLRVDKSASVTRIVLEEGAEEGAIYNQGEIEQIACYAEDARIYAEKGTIEGLWIYRPAIGTHINIEKEARIDACTVQAAEAIARGYGQLGQVRVVKGTKMPQIETKGTLIRQIQEEFQYAEPTPTVSPTAEE